MPALRAETIRILAVSTSEPSAVSGSSSALDAPTPRQSGIAATDLASVRSGQLQKSDIEALITRDYLGLRLLIFRRTRDIQVASDLLNDAICTAWEKWRAGQIARPEQIVAYIFQVAMNLLRNHRRAVAERPDRRAASEALDKVSVASNDVEIEARIAAKVLAIIRSMDSRRDRTVLVRFYLNEEDKETICRDLQLTPAQFAKVLHRARQRLRELVESQGLRGSDLFSWVLV